MIHQQQDQKPLHALQRTATTTANYEVIESGGSSSSSSGGGSGAPPEVSVTTGAVDEDTPWIIDVDSISQSVAFTEVAIYVDATATNAKLTIDKISSPGTGVDKPALVYQYLEIVTTNLPNSAIDRVVVKFAVDKSWITTNNVDASMITLHRWDGSQWDPLPTRIESTDSTKVHYIADLTGFSTFAIFVADAQPTIPVDNTNDTGTTDDTGGTPDTGTDTGDTGTDGSENTPPGAPTDYSVPIIAIIVIVIIGSIFYKVTHSGGKKKRTSYSYDSKKIK